MSSNYKLFKDKNVLITGHSGFKGSWLSMLLKRFGANVIGYSKPIDETNKHYNLLNLGTLVTTIEGDINNTKMLDNVFREYKPEIVFHLAAQAIVSKSYDDPYNTFQTNLMGSLNILNAINRSDHVKALVYITSDKCYENKEWEWGYRENDQLGGADPYSASKASAEILYSSYQRSFFKKKSYLRSASARAGNVIGGGDWASNRLIPDCIRSIENNTNLEIRNPKSTRPWQHVLEPLSGYLTLACKLMNKEKNIEGSFNFGPSTKDVRDVKTVATQIFSIIGKGNLITNENNHEFDEANLLQLNCDKANHYLSWMPKWNFSKSLFMTADWYKRYLNDENVIDITNDHINQYFENSL
ncbi:MAG: CDP-glucose 4,6-dehydratase [Flavobacteriales bacterium]|nr:CDP-glucose 4,6-dehydratase [Flavobacteriales bacterium]